MRDKEINNVVAYMMSPDFSNVLLGIELYQQQSDLDRGAIAEEFLSVWTGNCVNMYLYGEDFSERLKIEEGVFAAHSFKDPFPHTAIGLKFQTYWTIYLEMEISKDNIEPSSYMSGAGNLYAVGYKDQIEETAVTSNLIQPYWMEGRLTPHFNTHRDCMDFFFNAIHFAIHKHINQEE